MPKPIENNGNIARFSRPADCLKELQRREKEFADELRETQQGEKKSKFKNVVQKQEDQKSTKFENKFDNNQNIDNVSKKSNAPLKMPGRRFKHHEISVKHAQRLAKFAPLIQDSATRNGVPVPLICAVMLQESGGNPRAVSSAGATGLMQLMPGTAKRFGVKDIMNPAQNIEGGTRYLRYLLNRYKGNLELSLAAYNAGEHNVEKHGMKIPPFRETQNYVPSVLSYAQSIHDILTQPKLPSYAKRV